MMGGEVQRRSPARVGQEMRSVLEACRQASSREGKGNSGKETVPLDKGYLGALLLAVVPG